jgi:hypothetical protein
MPKFIFDNKDFESVKADIPKTDYHFELRKIDKIYYSIFEHIGNSVFECGTFTKTELKTIWQMLTI